MSRGANGGRAIGILQERGRFSPVARRLSFRPRTSSGPRAPGGLRKLVGILGFSWAAIRLGIARAPAGVGVRHLAALGLVSGVGFTVSIFLAQLAFSAELVRSAKLAILVASLTSGLAGYLLLRLAGDPSRDAEPRGPDRNPAASRT